MANKPIIPFNPNGPVLSASNDTGDTKPYVGKPKPMPPTTRPPGMGYSPGGGSFDASSLRRAPRPTMILPGQGQGPMPVGTKPLPTPKVKDPSKSPSMEDWIRNHPNGHVYDEGPWGGGRPNRPTLDTGDNRLNRGDMGMITDLGDGRGDLGMIRDHGMGLGPRNPEGYGWSIGQTIGAKPHWNGPPGTEPSGNWGAGRPFDPSGMGGPRDNNAGRLSQQAIASGLMNDTGQYRGPDGVRGPDGLMVPPGFGAGWGGDMGMITGMPVRPWDPNNPYPKQMPTQGGQVVAPGMGMPSQYGGGPSGRGGVEVPYDGMSGAVQRGPGAPGMPSGGNPPQGPQPGMPGPGGGRQPLRPGMEYRPGGGQRPQRPQQGGGANPQAMQQGAQALYSDNTIPHEFKGQLLQAAQSGNAQAFNEMLFNSGIPHETKLRLQQMFGYGSGAGAAPQAATPDQGQNQVQQSYNGGKGSPYYGAF